MPEPSLPSPAVWRVPTPRLPGHWHPATSGPIVAALRSAAGLTQTDMARRIGCGRHAVSWWETKRRPFLCVHGVPKRIVAELARLGFDMVATKVRPHPACAYDPITSARPVIANTPPRVRAYWSAKTAPSRCGAKTRKGHPCQAKLEPGRKRCRFHGGRSTGPRAPEGRARIAEAQRARWAAWRAARKPEPL
jgi:hypothetical protein